MYSKIQITEYNSNKNRILFIWIFEYFE
jgi:hypothetical protein